MAIRTIAEAQIWRANEDRKYNDIASAGAEQIARTEPVASAGLFAPALDLWEVGATYTRNAAFVYDDAVYFARQTVTAQAHQPPGSIGMEAIYGARPIPDDEGVYPYLYNMAAIVGMRVREGEVVFRCTQDIDPLLYPPSSVAAHFTRE